MKELFFRLGKPVLHLEYLHQSQFGNLGVVKTAIEKSFIGGVIEIIREVTSYQN